MSDEQMNNIDSSASIDSGTGQADISSNTSGDGSIQNVTSNTTEQNNGNASQSENATQRNVNAERGKISALEKERNELSQKLKKIEQEKSSYTQAFSKVEDYMKGDPTRYEAFRQDYLTKYGQDLGEYATRYGQQGSNQAPLQNVDPNSISQMIDRRVSEIEGQKQLKSTLYSIASELDPSKMESPEQADIAAVKAESVMIRASKLVDSGASNNVTEALQKAYNDLYGPREDQLESARKQGELLGYSNANARNVASNPGGSEPSNKASSAPKANLTANQQRMYEQELEKNPKMAEILLRNFSSRNN